MITLVSGATVTTRASGTMISNLPGISGALLSDCKTPKVNVLVLLLQSVMASVAPEIPAINIGYRSELLLVYGSVARK